MLENKDYCDYETSIALYKLGYDCQVIHLIAEKITLYEAQKWLREEKEFYVFVGREWENTYYYWISKKFGDKTEGITHSFYYPNGEGQFSSYEEALSEGIKEAVKILKEK